MSNEKENKESRTDKAVRLMNGSNELCRTVTGLTQEVNVSVAHAMEVYKHSLQVKQNIAAINAATTVELNKIAAKYKSCELFLNKTFSERGQALEAFYKILDNAIENNDRESLIAAMRGMSDIVTSSPLQDFEKFAELYNDTSKPLLDF